MPPEFKNASHNEIERGGGRKGEYQRPEEIRRGNYKKSGRKGFKKEMQ